MLFWYFEENRNWRSYEAVVSNANMTFSHDVISVPWIRGSVCNVWFSFKLKKTELLFSRQNIQGQVSKLIQINKKILFNKYLREIEFLSQTQNFIFYILSLQPYFIDLRYFKLWILSEQIKIVWNTKDLHHQVKKK